MAKLWCPICKTSFPIQADINDHLQQVHRHRIAPENEHLYRQMQNRKWQAREEALDLRLRQNSRVKRLEWAHFAEKPDGKDVPGSQMSEKLAREMIFLHEIDDDSASDVALLEDEGQTEDAGVVVATRLSAGTRGQKRSRAFVSKRSSSSSSSSSASEERSRKYRVKNKDVWRRLAEFEQAAHGYKTGRRLGPPNSGVQQELTSLSRARAEDLDDDRSNDADDERESSEESDDHEPDDEPTQIIGDERSVPQR